MVDEYIVPVGSLAGTGSHGRGTATVLVIGLMLQLVILILILGVVGMLVVNPLGVVAQL